MKVRKLILLLLVAVVMCGCSRLSYVDRQTGKEKVKYPHIRVQVLKAKKLELKCEGTYRLNCITPDSTAKGYYSVAPLKISGASAGLVIKEKSGFQLDQGLGLIFVSPRNRESHLSINGQPFRGVLEIYADGDSLEVVNVLNIEDYLRGVLPPEIGRLKKSEYEALKTQAVAARTYAYSRIKANSNKRYAVVNNIMDQVYIGINGEYALANQAIKDTHGEILIYNGELITAYYHSTCGGQTENIANAWDQHINGYLLSVADSNFCQWSKFYEWEMSWKPEVLSEYLRQYLVKNREYNGAELTISDIQIIERFPTGRISHLKVVTNNGDYLLFKDQIRWAFRRPNRPQSILPSSNFRIQMWRDSEDHLTEITTYGRGYGHGVGMCQCGVIGRARVGFTYDQILKTYYTGVTIKKAF